MAHIKDWRATGDRLGRSAEWKNADNAGGHPGDKASPAVSQLLGIRIDVVQSDHVRGIFVKSHDHIARRWRDRAPCRAWHLIRLQFAVLGRKLRNKAHQPDE